MGQLLDFSDIDKELMEDFSSLQHPSSSDTIDNIILDNKLESFYRIIRDADFPRNLINEDIRNEFRKVASYLVSIYGHIARIDYNL